MSINSAESSFVILSIELFDSVVQKFPLGAQSSQTTPKVIMNHIAKKIKVTSVKHLGLSYSFTGNDDPPSLAIQRGNHDWISDRIFLMDDVPILEQISKIPNNRLWMSLKHPFDNAFKDFDDPSGIPLIYRELKDRFILGTCEQVLSKEQIISLVAVQCHIRKEQNSTKTSDTSIDFLREATPVWHHNNLNEDFLNNCHERMKGFLQLSSMDGMKCFLNMVRVFLPHWIEYKYEATVIGIQLPLTLKIGADGIHVLNQSQKETNGPRTIEDCFIPYRLIQGWQMAYDEDANSSSNQQMIKKTDVYNWSFLCSNMGTSSVAIVKPSFDLQSPGKRKRFQYSLILKLIESHLAPVEIALSSNIVNDFRIADMMDFQVKRLKTRDLAEPFSVDDVDRFPYAYFTCNAITAHISNSPNELSFQEKDIIHVKKIVDGRIFGRCKGVEGTFAAEKVIFAGISSEIRKLYPDGNMKTTHGEVVIFHMLDETRKSLMVHPCHTVEQITRIIAEKLEIPQFFEFFGVFEIKPNNEERELWGKLPLLSQGVLLSSKLVLKLKCLYHDVSEIMEASLISLYYAQIKNEILNGSLTLSEAEVVDFASMQIQATWGDYDSEKYKNGFVGTINLTLPISYQKMSLSRNESWWQKKISTAHQQHKGLTRHEAEKAYIAMSQKLPMFGYRIFKQIHAEDNALAISRDHVLILDASMKVIEKIVLDFDNFTFLNESLIGKIKFLNEHTKREITYNMTSLQVFDMMNLFHFFYIVDAKARLRKRCRSLRESLSVLNIEIADTNASFSNLTDPELFVRGMMNGVALKLLAQILKQLISSTKTFTSSAAETNMQDIINKNSEMVIETLGNYKIFQRLDRSIVDENISAFFKFCHTDLTPSLPKGALSPSDLLDLDGTFDIKLSDKLLGALEAILLKNATVLVQLDAIKEYNRITKIKSKNLPLMAGGISNGVNQMTTEDFMRKVLDELFQTEVSYSKDLEKICATYVRPLSERVAYYESELEKSSCIETELLAIFGNIEEINRFHRDFCSEIETLCKATDAVNLLAQEFLNKADTFKKIYTVYCSNHVDPTERLPDLKTSAPEVLSIMGMTDTSSASAQGIYNDQLARHNLASLLIKPVQRIMRYSLLLKELVKYTPETHPGYNNLELALNKMKFISTDINEVKRKKENERNLLSLHAHLEGFDGSVMAFGELVLSGYLIFTEKQSSKNGKPNQRDTYHCFLFEDILFLCRDVIGNPSMFSSPNGRKSAGKSTSNSFGHSSSGSTSNINGYKFKSFICTRDLKVISSTNGDLTNNVDDMFTWEMLRQDLQKSFIITCRSLEEKDRWIQAIIDCGAKSAVKPPEERPDIDSAKKKLHAELAAINAPSTSSIPVTQDSAKVNIFSNTVKKLNSWKRETSPANATNNSQASPSAEVSAARKHRPPARIRSQDSLSSQRQDINAVNEQIETLDAIVRKLLEETQDLNNKINQAKRIAISGTGSGSFMSKPGQKHKSGSEPINANAQAPKNLKEQIIARLDEEKHARQELSAHVSALEAIMEASLSI